MASLPGAAMKKSSGYGSALGRARAISVSARAGDSGSLGCGSGQPYRQRISFCQQTTPPPSAVSNSTLCAEGRAFSRAPFTSRMAAMSLGIYYWGARSCLPQANFSGDEEE